MSLFGPEFERDLFGPDGVERLSTAINNKVDVQSFITATKVASARSSLFKVAYKFAVSVEPLDRSAGLLDENTSAAHAFLNGAAVSLGGLRLVTNASQREYIANNVQVPLQVPPHVDDEQQIRHLQAQRVMDLGHEGFHKHAKAYHKLFERHEQGISSQVRFDIHAQAGFGSVFYLVHKAVELDVKEDLTRSADTPIAEDGEDEWDKALRQMLGA